MLRTRVMPVLLLRGESLVKTKRFGRITYIGDPCNTVRIFNELEVDELVFLDITATREKRGPNLRLLRDIADECFMPLAYGGGITTFEQARDILRIGFEKVILNTAAVQDPALVEKLSAHCGSQAVIVSIDVKKDWRGRYTLRTHCGRRHFRQDPVEFARSMEAAGAGELLLTAIDREGTWGGFDLDLVRQVANAVNVPVIAHGGAGSTRDLAGVVQEGHASAVAVGSMVLFQQQGKGVLVNFPRPQELEKVLGGV